MPKHESMQEKIRSALEPLTPDEAVKNRMYLRILQRTASCQRKKRPWYLRWQVPAGICTVALACVVVIAAAVHTRLPQNGTEQLEVVPPTVTAVMKEETQTAVQTQTTFATQAQTSVQSGTKSIVTRSVDAVLADPAESGGQTQTITIDTAQDSQSSSEAQNSEHKPICHGTSVETTPVQTEVSAEYTVPAVVETRSTTASVNTKPVATETQAAMETAPSEESSQIGGDIPPIRQNIYLYNMLSWDGLRYETAYMPVDSRDLVYLGPGVTDGIDVSDTYTVLVYEIDGVDPDEQLAVQYVGENCYYLFTLA